MEKSQLDAYSKLHHLHFHLNKKIIPVFQPSVNYLSRLESVADGEIKVQEKGMQLSKYLNPEFKIFQDGQNLYLANLEGKYAFALASVRKLHTVDKHITVEEWNKEESYHKGIYKQYQLSEDKYGCIHCKCYHILEIENQGETYGFYFPSYELPAFQEHIQQSL